MEFGSFLVSVAVAVTIVADGSLNVSLLGGPSDSKEDEMM